MGPLPHDGPLETRIEGNAGGWIEKNQTISVAADTEPDGIFAGHGTGVEVGKAG